MKNEGNSLARTCVLIEEQLDWGIIASSGELNTSFDQCQRLKCLIELDSQMCLP